MTKATCGRDIARTMALAALLTALLACVVPNTARAAGKAEEFVALKRITVIYPQSATRFRSLDVVFVLTVRGGDTQAVRMKKSAIEAAIHRALAARPFDDYAAGNPALLVKAAARSAARRAAAPAHIEDALIELLYVK